MNRPAFNFTVAGGSAPAIQVCESDVPLGPALARDGAALAVITGVEGPSYRPVGAVMAIDAGGATWGSLSSGCIERDVVLHARQALADGQARALRYGAGSPFRDLALPCGGGLDILILPRPDRAALRHAATRLAARHPALLRLGPLTLQVQPQPRFLTFGKGPEAHCFAALASATGFPVEALSPDPDTLTGLANTHLLPQPVWPPDLAIDARTAVTLFFHDHDWEPALLAAALQSPAIYVGAQGSLRAHRARCEALAAMGLPPERIGRLESPFGLIPSARDPRTLAASVLAQVLARMQLR